jgi:hypothetical protein
MGLCLVAGQRVSSVLWRTRLSCGRMIWLLTPPPISHFPVSIGSTGESRHTGRLSKKENLLTEEGRWGGKGLGRSQTIRQQESLILYKIIQYSLVAGI